MKNSWIAVAALTAGVSLPIHLAWSSRVFDVLSGTVTTAPVVGEIEVDHHVYHIKPRSQAEKQYRSCYVGDAVDLVLDGPPANANSQVSAITRHSSK